MNTNPIERERAEYAKMTLEEACAELSSRVYNAALLIERLEGAGKVFGNGHHAAQKIAAAAVEDLKARWIHPKG